MFWLAVDPLRSAEPTARPLQSLNRETNLHRSTRLRRQQRLVFFALLFGLLVATVGLLEPGSHRQAGREQGLHREAVVVAGLFTVAVAGGTLLVLLGRRDPHVPDEKYYGLIAPRSSGRRSLRSRR